jgi:hypothetical protein
MARAASARGHRMTPLEVLSEARRSGLRVRRSDGSLLVRGSRELSELAEALLAAAVDVAAHLADCCAECGAQGRLIPIYWSPETSLCPDCCLGAAEAFDRTDSWPA